MAQLLGNRRQPIRSMLRELVSANLTIPSVVQASLLENDDIILSYGWQKQFGELLNIRFRIIN